MPRRKKQARLTWTDHAGKTWVVPNIKDRLRPWQIAGHAALKAHVICRDGGRCVQCGACDDLVVDHVVSRRNGGTHHLDNLRALCKPCNDAKSNYEDRGRQSTKCGQLDFHGGLCARTAGHHDAHVGPRLPRASIPDLGIDPESFGGEDAPHGVR